MKKQIFENYPSFDEYMKDKDKYDYFRTFDNQVSIDYAIEEFYKIGGDIRQMNRRSERVETIVELAAVVGIVYVFRKPIKKFIRKTVDYFKSL